MTVWPGVTLPVLNAPACGATAVTVWVAVSSLWTVTVSPGDTVSVAGWKAKFLMTMVAAEEVELDCGVEALVPELVGEVGVVLEQAVSSTPPISTTPTNQDFRNACPCGTRDLVRRCERVVGAKSFLVATMGLR